MERYHPSSGLPAPGKANSGFTMIELLMVVSIMAIVGMIGLGTVAMRTPEYRLEQAAWKIMTAMRKARMQAVSENANVQVSFDDTTKEFKIWSDLNKNNTADAGEVTTEKLSLLPDINLYSHPNSGKFTSHGTFNSSQDYCYLQVFNSSGGYKRIYIFPSGEIHKDFN